MTENNKTMFELESELKLLDGDYEKLHCELVQAEADDNEIEIIILLHKIHTVAKKQAEIKKVLNKVG